MFIRNIGTTLNSQMTTFYDYCPHGTNVSEEYILGNVKNILNPLKV
jgi:hypothetical protein